MEDEGTVAMMIEDMLKALGCQIVSSVAHVAQAREIAAKANIGVAVLDVNVAGLPIFPVAEVLQERQVPFLFSTGYVAGSLPAAFADRPLLKKPFAETELKQKLAFTLRGME